MQAIIFALISYIGWGAGDIFGAISSRKIGAFSTAFWVSLFGAIIFSLYIPFAIGNLGNITLPILILNILLGLLFIVASVSFNQALRVANVSLVGTIVSSYPALTVILAVLFLYEVINVGQLLAIIIIFTGVIFSTCDLRNLLKPNLLSAKGVNFAIIAMISYGLYFTFIKIPVAQIGWFWPNYITFLLFPFIYLYMKNRRIKLVRPDYQNAIFPLIICTLLLRIGDFSFNIGISKGLTAIVAPIAGAYPTLFALLGFLVFKDSIKKQQIVGICITLFGIVALSMLSI